MPTQSSSKKLDSQNVYIGIDVHLRQWNVCIYQGGIRRRPFQQSPSVKALLSHLRANYPGMIYHSAYEAGVCGNSIHYELEDNGIHNIVFNPADIAQKDKERKRKTDKVDSSKIARALSNGELECIHIPTKERTEHRNMLRVRNCCISDVKRSKIRLRHLLHVNGIGIPPEYCNGRWPQSFFAWLQELYPDPNATGQAIRAMTHGLQSQLSLLKDVEPRIRNLMEEACYAEDFRLLRTIPGIGETTAYTLLLECGDLSAFSSADKFCAFVGLIPDSDISDLHEVKCGITRRRHKTLRYMLTEAAWRAISMDSSLSRLYAKYTHRMPKQKAIVKIAHKLAKIIKFVVTNKTAYDASKAT